jgi:RNA 2',3'-cyclic 3'-phosphodiesterase
VTHAGPRDRGARARRLFVAVEVPEEVHGAIDRAVAPWREVLAARWVPARNRHVTLRFLGAVAADRIALVEAALTTAASSSGRARTRLTGLGAFPSPGRARVLWVGIDDAPGRLAAIAHALDGALLSDFPPEPRPLRPHLTLARCDPAVRLPATFVDTAVEPVPFEVRRLVLFESVPSGSGPPRYEPLVTAALLA